MFLMDRQERFPEEFRIKSKEWDYQTIIEEISKEPEKIESIDLDILKDVILRIWRINNKATFYQSNNKIKRSESLVKNNDDFEDYESEFIIKSMNTSLKQIKFMGNQSQSVLNLLKDNGFEIKDHTNSKYYDGMALKVLVFEEGDVEESTITETIKPSIFYNDELILNGEVVVTTPKSE